MEDEKKEVKIQSEGVDWATTIMLMTILSAGGLGSGREIDQLKADVAELKGKMAIVEKMI